MLPRTSVYGCQSPRTGVYGISVTAGLTGIDPQTLRLYERRGLIAPDRTPGGTRRYSDADDVAALRHITALVAGGVNIAGIGRILHLDARNQRLEEDNAYLRSMLGAYEKEGAPALRLRPPP
ncbi:MerR family transcriptional regulator [Rhodococcus sp. SJ-2]